MGTSFETDVYSFGIVVWEVFSRTIPWSDEANPKDIYVRVVFRGERPRIPVDSPPDMARVMRACWAAAPSSRPAFSYIMKWQSWE
ncbi:unnamed protein product [Laminaria digitata]